MGQFSRRDVLAGGLGGSALWVLRAAASGLPLAFLRSATARAESANCSPTDADLPALVARPDFLIFSTSADGDPLNINCPGSYVSGARNNPVADLAPTTLRLGGLQTTAARPWSTLPQAMLDRTYFFHHMTHAAAHPENLAVLRLHGAVKNQLGAGEEMLPSMVASETAAALGTIQVEPVALGATSVTFGGAPLASMLPSKLLALFQGAPSALAGLSALRDRTVDALHAELRQNGTHAQRLFLERYAASREQARELGNCLGGLLARLPVGPGAADGAEDQLLTAIALFKLRFTPTVVLKIPFGGDNHRDTGFENEAAQTVSGVEALRFMWTELAAAGLTEQVTFANLNTFGRTLMTSDGRGHNGGHHVMTVIGRRVRAGVVGGVARAATDFAATAIDSVTGASHAAGDVPADETLQAAGKTLAAALGLARSRIDTRISGGRVVESALASTL